MGYYNRRDLAARYQREAIAREMAAAGHDEPAAERARHVVSLEGNIAEAAEGNWPAELQAQVRQHCQEEIAKIRAAGPVGCTCEYWRCVESRPSQG